VSTTFDVLPQLVANDGLRTLRAAIVNPEHWAIEPKVEGVRGLVIFEGGRIATRNRRGEVRHWLRPCPLETALRRLVQRLPILDRGTVLDGELVAERFAGTIGGAARLPTVC
jgi:ATP-dependent DNA ligase